MRRLTAAAVLSLTLAVCVAEPGKAQQPSSRVYLTDLSDAPVPALDGRLIVGSGTAVFGMVLRGRDEAEPDLVIVEMLTSQTTSQMRIGSDKIDAMSFVYQLDCPTMRYRLQNQVSYKRNGEPMSRTNLANAMIDGPMADYLQPACGRTPPEGIEHGEGFSSMEAFLAAADPIQEARRASMPRTIVTVTRPSRQN